MYNVNTQRIEEILTYIDHSLLPSLQAIMQSGKQELLSDSIAAFAAERIVHLFIEGMTDVGNFLIDGFIMRDPGSYEDIVDIMEDEGVYTTEQAVAFKDIVLLRKDLVQNYTVSIHERLYDVYAEHSNVMNTYTSLIRSYLKKELW